MKRKIVLFLIIGVVVFFFIKVQMLKREQKPEKVEEKKVTKVAKKVKRVRKKQEIIKTKQVVQKGDVFIKDPKTGKWLKTDALKPKDFKENMVIKTSKKAVVRAEISEKKYIEIGDNTEIKVKTIKRDKKKKWENISLEIFKGRISSNVAPIKDHKFSITTPSAVAAVRGTTFVVKVDDYKNSNVYVLAGKIRVVSALKEKILIKAYEKISITKAGRLSPVEKLSPEDIERMLKISFADLKKGLVE